MVASGCSKWAGIASVAVHHVPVAISWCKLPRDTRCQCSSSGSVVAAVEQPCPSVGLTQSDGPVAGSTDGVALLLPTDSSGPAATPYRRRPMRCDCRACAGSAAGFTVTAAAGRRKGSSFEPERWARAARVSAAGRTGSGTASDRHRDGAHWQPEAAAAGPGPGHSQSNSDRVRH